MGQTVTFHRREKNTRVPNKGIMQGRIFELEYIGDNTAPSIVHAETEVNGQKTKRKVNPSEIRMPTLPDPVRLLLAGLELLYRTVGRRRAYRVELLHPPTDILRFTNLKKAT